MTPKDNTGRRFPDDRFEEIFEHYSSGLLVYARHFLFSRDAAEDIVHDVFTNLWEKMDTVEPDKVRSYLFTATRNSCLNYLSHLKMRTRYQNEILKEQDLPGAFEEEHYVLSEMKAIVDTAIAKLPPQRRKIFLMNRYEKKTFAQIAVELEISPKTVDKHVELALKDLRRELGSHLSLLAIAGYFWL